MGITLAWYDIVPIILTLLFIYSWVRDVLLNSDYDKGFKTFASWFVWIVIVVANAIWGGIFWW